MHYLDNITTILEEGSIDQNLKGEIISLIAGVILIVIGILACMWEPYSQEQILRTISKTVI